MTTGKRNLAKIKPGQVRSMSRMARNSDRGTSTWPRLSATLGCEARPDHCQHCGRTVGDSIDLERWQEHDEHDRPEAIVIVLCSLCSDALIDPHPRLYRKLHAHEPWPGCMQLCTDCVHRQGVSCTHPSAKVNGGEGLALTMPEPLRGFIDYCDRAGRRRGEMMIEYRGPVTGCAGREMRGEAIDRQSCGHPVSAIESSDEGTHYCRQCEAEAADEAETPTGAKPSPQNPAGAARKPRGNGTR